MVVKGVFRHGAAMVGFVNIILFVVLIYLFFHESRASIMAPNVTRERFIDVGLVLTQTLLTATTLGIGILAIFGYQVIRAGAVENAEVAARKAAKVAAEDVAVREIRAFLDKEPDLLAAIINATTACRPNVGERGAMDQHDLHEQPGEKEWNDDGAI